MLPGLPMSGTLDIWQCQSAVLCARAVQNLPNVQHFGHLAVPKCCTVCAWGPEFTECTALWTSGSAKVLYCVRVASRICRMYSTLDVLSTTRIPPYYRQFHILVPFWNSDFCSSLWMCRIRGPKKRGLRKLTMPGIHRSQGARATESPRDADPGLGPHIPPVKYLPGGSTPPPSNNSAFQQYEAWTRFSLPLQLEMQRNRSQISSGGPS